MNQNHTIMRTILKAGAGGLRTVDISERTGISTNYVSCAITKMTAAGWIVRADPNKYVGEYIVTCFGVKAFNEQAPLAEKRKRGYVPRNEKNPLPPSFVFHPWLLAKPVWEVAHV